jgi:hypothetical protein
MRPTRLQIGMLLGGETANVLLNTLKDFARGCLPPEFRQVKLSGG